MKLHVFDHRKNADAPKGRQEKKEKDTAADVQERCVVCGRMTGISRSCPIAERTHYIEGAGQLCEECYREVYEDPRLLRRIDVPRF